MALLMYRYRSYNCTMYRYCRLNKVFYGLCSDLEATVVLKKVYSKTKPSNQFELITLETKIPVNFPAVSEMIS
jgi:hypothetical protein